MGQLMDWYNQNQRAMAQQNAYGQLGGALGSIQGLANHQVCYPDYANYSGNNFGTATAGTTAIVRFDNDRGRSYVIPDVPVFIKQAKKAWKKTNNILVDLRHEIDEWHGDILMRAA